MKKMMIRRLLQGGCFLILMLSVGVSFVGAQQPPINFAIQDIDNTYFPYLKVYASAASATGDPISGLTADNFSLMEDGISIEDYDLSYVQNAEQPISFVIALDTSPSMNQNGANGTKLEDSIEAIRAFLPTVAAHDEVALVTFGGGAQVVQGLTSDTEALASKLDQISTKEITYVYDGLYESLLLLENVESRPVILLVSDGADSSEGEHTLEDVLSKAAADNIQVYPIGFGSVRASELYAIAEQTGGVASIDRDTSGLKSLFSNLIQNLRQQYVFEYKSELQPDDASHMIGMELSYTGITKSHSREFTATLGIPPVDVKLISPDEGEKIAIPTVITAEVTGVAPLVSVQFFVDGAELAVFNEEAIDGEYEVLLDQLETLSPGNHSIKVIGTDKNGLTGEGVLTLSVRPVVIILQPQPEASLYGETTIELDIAEEFSATTIGLYVDGVEMIPSSRSGLTMHNWIVTSLQNGAHELGVVAVNAKGEMAFSSVRVVVNQSGGGNQGGMGPAILIVIIVVIVIGGVLIPLTLRKRKQAVGGDAQAVLIELQGKNPGHAWGLVKFQTKLGRKGAENDIPLQGVSASRHMAVILNNESGYEITSLNPSNPVMVNGNPITGPYILRSGDELVLGESVFKFEFKTNLN